MEVKYKKHETPKQQTAEKSGSDSDADQSTVEHGAEVHEQMEAVGEVYDKTAQAVSKTYEKTKNYCSKNPGKTMLVALGIGVGLGFLLGAGARRSGAGRFARPVVNALSGIALELFR